MHKLEVTLKQHTPLIHFQHDQEGATLRASEVKPKLDKFILTKLGENADNEQKNIGIREARKEGKIFEQLDFYGKGNLIAKGLGWLVGKGNHPALDYKIKISAKGERKEFFIVSYLKKKYIAQLQENSINVICPSPFFAQEKSTSSIINNKYGFDKNNWNKIEKKGILYDQVIIVLLTQSSDVIKIIENHIHSFFLTENFGTRQSKGFGCFEVIFPKLKNDLSNEKLLKSNFSFVYKKSIDTSNMDSVFQTILSDYKLLKSGRSKHEGGYAKSKLFLYGLRIKNPIRWEKRFIKLNINNYYKNKQNPTDNYILKTDRGNSSSYGAKDSEKSWEDTVEYNYVYLRAVLGIAEQFEFLTTTDKTKLIVKLSDTNKVIERFKSPIMFKIVDSYIYLVGNDLSQELKGEFSGTVYRNIDGVKTLIDDSIGGDLSIPENFSLNEFIKFAMEDDTNNAKLGYKLVK